MKPNEQIKNIFQSGNRHLTIEWLDGDKQEFDVVELRRKCPCAECIDEITKKPLLNPVSVAETVRPVRLDSVGRYALNISFSDGHNTGIYSFSFLKAWRSSAKN